MFKYETHLHTYPVSKCAKAGIRESLEFYKSKGYDGVFVTNHFIDANINIDKTLPYKEKIEFYFSDYEEGVKIAKEIGIKVFSGVEIAYNSTHFLIYGLDKEWYLSHPEIEDMPKADELKLMEECGALIIQAHPFREWRPTEPIRLYPRMVHGVEIDNSSQTDVANDMAKKYADSYELIPFAGSDNHSAGKHKRLAGIITDEPVRDEAHFMELVKSKKTQTFTLENK